MPPVRKKEGRKEGRENKIITVRQRVVYNIRQW